jgi:predicted transposase/invertase (TIGR01784 family)
MMINRKNDYAFKRIFGHEDTKDILAGFLSAVLDVPIRPEELTLIPTALNPEYLADKPSKLDIHVRRSEFHEKMNVEMQQESEGNIERRLLHYWGRNYTGELKEGQDYSELPRLINIAIADFHVFEWRDKTKFHGIFNILERNEGVLFSDALEIHVLELPKLRRQPLKTEWTALERWCLYLDNMEGELMEQIATQDPLIGRALTVEDVFAKAAEERFLYEMRERARLDHFNAINTAKKLGVEEGRELGVEEGRERGLEEGMERGVEKGTFDALRKTARSMLADGMAPDLIAKFTDLPVEEIEALR